MELFSDFLKKIYLSLFYTWVVDSGINFFLCIGQSVGGYYTHFLNTKSMWCFSVALVKIAIMSEVGACPALLPPLQSEGFSFRLKVTIAS